MDDTNNNPVDPTMEPVVTPPAADPMTPETPAATPDPEAPAEGGNETPAA